VDKGTGLPFDGAKSAFAISPATESDSPKESSVKFRAVITPSAVPYGLNVQ